MSERVALAKRVEGAGQYMAQPPDDVEFFSSGSKLLDLALGGGGWAEGRIANVIGDKSTGKTLLCIEACNNFARKYPKGRIRYRESEQAFQKGYAAALGMPVDRVDFGKKPLVTVENMFTELDELWDKAKVPTLTIVDSLDALSDAAEMDREFGEGSYGAQKAKDLSKMFRLLISKIGIHTLIIVSQIRDKIGVKFGRQWTRSGGRALDFYASQTVVLAHLNQISRTIKSVKRTTGINVRAKLDKNKVGMPYREADFPIIFGYGIDDDYACRQWLEAVGMKGIKECPVDELHKIVEEKWYEIENSFLPKKPKYPSIT